MSKANISDKLFFATGNNGKVESQQREFSDIKIIQRDIDLVEDCYDVGQIAINKVDQAFEYLEADLKLLLLAKDLELPQPFEKVNVTPNRESLDWKDCFSYAAIMHIENIFAEEIEKYGYGIQKNYTLY